jgi:hypothetical protein
MEYVIGSLVALATLGLAIGSITGKVTARSCCAPADPSRDRRMQTERAVELTDRGANGQVTSAGSTGHEPPRIR